MAIKNNKSDNELLQEISAKLSDIFGIMSIAGKDRQEQVKHLVSLGFTNADIARITGMPKGTVDGIRATAQSKGKK